MTVSLPDRRKAALAEQGAITDTTTVGGDIGGTLPNPQVTGLRGFLLPASGYSDGIGIRFLGGQWGLTTVLDENSNFSGDVSGTQAAGLTVAALNGITAEIETIATGQIIGYDGSNLVPQNLVQGFTVTDVKTGTYTANNREIVPCNTTAGAFAVTLPANPQQGWEVFVQDDFNIAGTNFITVLPSGSDTIDNGTSLLISLNSAIVKFTFNGTYWQYFVYTFR